MAPSSSSSQTRTPAALPPFSALPIQNPGPPLNAWGLYGSDDEHGRLNLINSEAVKRGRDAIKHGIAVNLNLPLSSTPLHPARPYLEHKIAHRGHVNDDHVSFNTQTSTQVDGFRHYPYQNYPKDGEYTYYNGMSTEDAKNPTLLRNGIQNFAKKPITSRGHLLDIPLYLSEHSLPPISYLTTDTPISAETLQAAADWHAVDIQPGDILLVRTGFTEAFEGMSDNEREQYKDSKARASCGVSPDEATLKWHWEKGIAAVGTDTVAYEVYPSPGHPSIHETFLAGWGLPIGELYDLRELADRCRELEQYTFLYTSMPLYVEAGIASPPNAQAIL